MKNYIELLHKIMLTGEDYGNRTAYTRRSLSHGQRSLHFDLRKGIPIPSMKRLNYVGVFKELKGFLDGSNNVAELGPIWQPWSDETGYIGEMYGACFRNWNGDFDQLEKVVSDIQKYPNASDLVMTTWNPETVPNRDKSPVENVKCGNPALANCHGTVIQFYVREGFLDMTTFQRSADMAVGVPYNLLSYAMFQFLVAQECGLQVRYMDYCFGDAHIYHNQFEGVEELFRRTPDDTPVHLSIPKGMGVFNFDPKQVEVLNYNPQPAINFGEIAV
ncbi:MAG: thymidylate synthase [Alteromonas sp.]|nr:thymidylate synthase [Alteromonas sp.]